jgi:hypothetical protein
LARQLITFATDNAQRTGSLRSSSSSHDNKRHVENSEATGDRPAALQALRTLAPKLGDGWDAGFRSDVTREIKRLEREPRRE